MTTAGTNGHVTAELTQRAIEAHGRFQKSGKLCDAIECGEYLDRIFQTLPHGGWTPYTDKSLPMTRTTASQYRVAYEAAHREAPEEGMSLHQFCVNERERRIAERERKPKKALEMLRAGVGRAEVAKQLKVGMSTINRIYQQHVLPGFLKLKWQKPQGTMTEQAFWLAQNRLAISEQRKHLGVIFHDWKDWASSVTGVSIAAIQTAVEMLRHSPTPELMQAYLKDQISQRASVRIAQLPADKQLDALKDLELGSSVDVFEELKYCSVKFHDSRFAFLQAVEYLHEVTKAKFSTEEQKELEEIVQSLEVSGEFLKELIELLERKVRV